MSQKLRFITFSPTVGLNFITVPNALTLLETNSLSQQGFGEISGILPKLTPCE